jgi:mono/diheme cytochrome c family protein
MIPPVMSRRLLLPALPLLVAAGLLAGCGQNSVDVGTGASASAQEGAQLFAERCSGCHTFEPSGSEGSATKVSDRERVDGPNFNVRKVCYDSTLFALRNGGYSGAIMPANIVVGEEAKAVARYLAEYSGFDAPETASPTGPAVKCPPLPPEGG